MTESTIPIPESAPPRARRRLQSFEDYGSDFVTLEEAETLAQGTGEHRGTRVEYSDDAKGWFEAWVPPTLADGSRATHPEYARATVLRIAADGTLVERRVVVRWDEYVPDEDAETFADWLKMPTVMLGKCAVVAALRSLFRDVIGNRYEPAELHQAGAAA